MTKWKMNTADARVVAESAPKMNALVLPTSSPALAKICCRYGSMNSIPGQDAQPPVEFARSLDETLDLRANDLGDAQRLVRAGAKHARATAR